MKMIRASNWLVGAIALIGTAYGAGASEPLTGADIAGRMSARQEGAAVERVLDMVLTDKRGKERRRSATVARRQAGDQKETVICFTAPRSVKGMAFLTHDRIDPDQEDEQWLYLPAMKKVRRIPASDRGDYFLGTDFSYNDVKEELKFEPQDYLFTYQSSFEEGGKTFHRLSGVPSSTEIAKELGYGAFKAVVAEESWMPIDIEFADLDGAPLKRILVEDVRLIDGIWSALRIQVTNLQSQHKTVFTYSDVTYFDDMADDQFALRSLKSARGR